MSEKVRVRGCIHGLDSDKPKNPKRICRVPCDWRINSTDHMNCAWSLFDYLAKSGKTLNLRAVGAIMGTTHETVRNIEISASAKIRKGRESRDDVCDINMRHTSFKERVVGDEPSEEEAEIIRQIEESRVDNLEKRKIIKKSVTEGVGIDDILNSLFFGEKCGD